MTNQSITWVYGTVWVMWAVWCLGRMSITLHTAKDGFDSEKAAMWLIVAIAGFFWPAYIACAVLAGVASAVHKAIGWAFVRRTHDR